MKRPKSTKRRWNVWARKMGLISLILLLLVFGLSGFCAAEENSDDFVLEETVVTATKTGETKLQKTPISITALDDEFLDNSNVFEVSDLSQYAPNTQFEKFGPAVMIGYIRGIGNNTLAFGGTQNVGFYLDGEYLVQGFVGNQSLFDVERIELLRGPQGTLYGRNTTAGAVNIITKKPSDDLELKLGLEVGNYDKRRVDAMISGPLIKDKVNVRLSFSDTAHDGYIENLAGPDIFDDDSTGMRGSILFKTFENVEFQVGMDYYDLDSRGSNNVLMTPVPDDFWKTYQNYDAKQVYKWWGLSGRVKIELPHDLVLRSLTGYRDWEFRYRQDVDTTPLTIANATGVHLHNTFSQELQLDGGWGKWKWVLGGYYLHEEEEMPEDWDWPTLELGLPFPPFLTTYLMWGTIETDAYAGFVNATYAFTDKLSLEGGIRYSYEEKNVLSIKDLWNPVPLLPPIVSAKNTESWSAVTPKFGIHYQITEEALLYGIISWGFKSGVFAPNNPVGTEKWVDPEYLINYEIGFKTDWFDNRLRVNGSGFYIDYTDQQVPTLIFPDKVISNAGESRITGVELELLARPVGALTLNGAISFLDAEFEKYPNAFDTSLNVVDVTGNSLPFAPEWKLNFGAQYVLPVGEYGFLTLRGDLTWTDRQFFDATHETGQDDYTLLNGLLRFETADGHWSFEAFVRNLGEDEYLISGLITPMNTVVGNVGAPRTFGFQATYNY